MRILIMSERGGEREMSECYVLFRGRPISQVRQQ